MSNNLDQDRVRYYDSDIDIIKGVVPYGYYLNEIGCLPTDTIFEDDCQASIKWAARRLGWPVVDLEITHAQMAACFETAVQEYNRIINEFNIVNNLLDVVGLDVKKYNNLTGVNLYGTGLPFIVRLSRMYGTEAVHGGVGGTVELYRGYFDTTGSRVIEGINNPDGKSYQVFDLNEILIPQNPKVSGSRIEIRRIYNQNEIPAIAKIYDPYSLTGMSYSNILSEMGFFAYSPATQFLMCPIFEDLLRTQAIEFNDTIRKSAYSFEITGDNKLRIFPYVDRAMRIFIDYYIEDEKFAGQMQNPDDPYSTSSDPSDVPYGNCKYCRINQPGKQWIRDFFLALCKETLGQARGKYPSGAPIPGDYLVLDGSELRTEAETEKSYLRQHLRDLLEKTLKVSQMENKSKEAEVTNKMLAYVPMHIYIGPK